MPTLRDHELQRIQLLQIGDGSLPESLAIRISGRSLNSVCNTALLYPIVWLDGPGAVGFLLPGITLETIL